MVLPQFAVLNSFDSLYKNESIVDSQPVLGSLFQKGKSVQPQWLNITPILHSGKRLNGCTSAPVFASLLTEHC